MLKPVVWRALNDLAVIDGRLRDFGIVPEQALRENALGVLDWSDTAPTLTSARALFCAVPAARHAHPSSALDATRTLGNKSGGRRGALLPLAGGHRPPLPAT